MFKTRKNLIIHIVVFILVIIGFVYLGTLNFNENLEQNEIFISEFDRVPLENIYEYNNAREVLAALDDTAVILLGSKLNPWTEDSAILLNEVALENGIDKILYYDFFEDRNINNGNYELLVEKLSDYLYTLDNDTQDLLAPTIIFVKNGDIIYYNDETGYVRGNIEPEKYWTESKKLEYKANLSAGIKAYLEE